MTTAVQPKKPSKRRTARIVAVQALYAWELTGNPIQRVIEETVIDRDIDDPIDFLFYKTLVTGVAKELASIEEVFAPYLDRKVGELNFIERAILRVGVYELIFQLEIPYRIIINESIDLAKQFGAQSSHKYINGVLDQVSKKVRLAERSA